MNALRLFDEDEYRKYDIVVLLTHGGVFHADDVCSTALLKIMLDKWQPSAPVVICRSLGKTEEDFRKDVVEMTKDDTFIAVIVFDIGGGDFDHHQGQEFRENPDGTQGVPYAAFGKLWRTFGVPFLEGDVDAAHQFEQSVVQPIDAGDNGVGLNPLSGLISAYNPNWNEDQSDSYRKDQFKAAMRQMQLLFESWFVRVAAGREAMATVRMYREQSIELQIDSRILFMPKFVPVGRLLVDEFPNVLFTVTPSLRGGWNLQAVRKDPEKFGNKMDLPKSWLEEAPDGCTYIHQQRFLAAFDSSENAIKAAGEILDSLNAEGEVDSKPDRPVL